MLGASVVAVLVVAGAAVVVLGAGVVASVSALHAEAASNTANTSPHLFTV